MEIHFAQYTLRGRRHLNEDQTRGEMLPRNARGVRAFLAVADGMGGMAAGEVASRTAIQSFQRALRGFAHEPESGEEEGMKSFFLQAYAAVNRDVHEEGLKSPARSGMGTTLTCVVILRDATYMIANVGDSRAYLVNGQGAAQLTEDHSALAEEIKRNALKPENGRQYSFAADALTRCIGESESPEVDVYPLSRLSDGDILFLCTDGLHKAVSSDDIKATLLSHGDLRQAVEALAHLAFARGSDDNISLAALQCGEREVVQLRHENKSVPRAVRAAVAALTTLFLGLVATAVFLVVDFNGSHPEITPPPVRRAQGADTIPASRQALPAKEDSSSGGELTRHPVSPAAPGERGSQH